MIDDKKISELDVMDTVGLDDIFSIVQSGVGPLRTRASQFLGDLPKSQATQVVAASDTPNGITRADVVCDGTADQVQIQAAIDALPALGGTVQILEGNYSIDGSIFLLNLVDIAILGSGPSTEITATTNAVMFSITDSSGLSFSKIKLVGSGIPLASQTGIAINDNGDDISITHCIFEDLGYDAVYALRNTRGLLVAYNTIKRCQDDGINPGGGALVGGDVGTDLTRVIGNHIEGVVNDGIHISDNNLKTIVVGNTILDCGEGIALINTDDVIVANNIIDNPTGQAIRIHWSDGCVVTDNILMGGGILEVGTADFNMIVNNKLDAGELITVLGANTVVRGNMNFVTENGARSAAIATGGTIAHGLAITPTIVQVNAAEAGPTDITISVDAANITVNFGGGGNRTFYWYARVYP